MCDVRGRSQMSSLHAWSQLTSSLGSSHSHVLSDSHQPWLGWQPGFCSHSPWLRCTLLSLKGIRGVLGFTKCWGSLSTHGPSGPAGGSLGPLCSALGANGAELLAGPLPLECEQQRVHSVGVQGGRTHGRSPWLTPQTGFTHDSCVTSSRSWE